jgi:hypothetical protein
MFVFLISVFVNSKNEKSLKIKQKVTLMISLYFHCISVVFHLIFRLNKINYFQIKFNLNECLYVHYFSKHQTCFFLWYFIYFKFYIFKYLHICSFEFLKVILLNFQKMSINFIFLKNNQIALNIKFDFYEINFVFDKTHKKYSFSFFSHKT